MQPWKLFIQYGFDCSRGLSTRPRLSTRFGCRMRPESGFQMYSIVGEPTREIGSKQRVGPCGVQLLTSSIRPFVLTEDVQDAALIFIDFQLFLCMGLQPQPAGLQPQPAGLTRRHADCYSAESLPRQLPRKKLKTKAPEHRNSSLNSCIIRASTADPAY